MVKIKFNQRVIHRRTSANLVTCKSFPKNDPLRESVRLTGPVSVGTVQIISSLPPILQECYLETFLEYCYPWCPILDQQDLSTYFKVGGSILLQHAMALVGILMRPPILQHDSSSSHYDKAKMLFYGNHEPSPLIRIMAVMLFYWWSACPPSVVSYG